MNLAPSFAIGYHSFHPDVSINYQLNRFCDGATIHRGRVMPGQQARADSRGRVDHPGSLAGLAQEAGAQSRVIDS